MDHFFQELLDEVVDTPQKIQEILSLYRNQLELMTASKMGLGEFFSTKTHLTMTDLVDLFLFEMCRNVDQKGICDKCPPGTSDTHKRLKGIRRTTHLDVLTSRWLLLVELVMLLLFIVKMGTLKSMNDSEDGNLMSVNDYDCDSISDLVLLLPLLS
ncbi:hypothetical protein POM88_054694 [Heracleum sosnowskyi]|uniref:Uncharacterized protein n=1 Tax=Heracleum sosnowskyi TaxID=360622 RepID=A0AAD8GN74_9APIA|nr:hypothetical protein POM88_054694 [Heracleum sosnowskyi]